MKRVALLAFLALPCSGFAQSLTDQINAVSAAQDQNEAAARQAWAEQQAELRHQEQAQAARAQQARRQAEAVAAARRAKLEAREAKDEAYADKLRELDLQSRELDLQAKKTDVSRENDIIDSTLKQKDAAADLTRSQADANRNVSQGAKVLMEKNGAKAELEGQAAVKKESGWFH